MVTTSVVQGWGEVIGGEVQIFQRDGGSRDTAGGGGVVEDGVVVRSVNQSVRHQGARPQPDSRDPIYFNFNPNMCHIFNFRFRSIFYICSKPICHQC